jgi:CHY zinc finger/F-box-like
MVDQNYKHFSSKQRSSVTITQTAADNEEDDNDNNDDLETDEQISALIDDNVSLAGDEESSDTDVCSSAGSEKSGASERAATEHDYDEQSQVDSTSQDSGSYSMSTFVSDDSEESERSIASGDASLTSNDASLSSFSSLLMSSSGSQDEQSDGDDEFDDKRDARADDDDDESARENDRSDSDHSAAAIESDNSSGTDECIAGENLASASTESDNDGSDLDGANLQADDRVERSPTRMLHERSASVGSVAVKKADDVSGQPLLGKKSSSGKIKESRPTVSFGLRTTWRLSKLAAAQEQEAMLRKSDTSTAASPLPTGKRLVRAGYFSRARDRMKKSRWVKKYLWARNAEQSSTSIVRTSSDGRDAFPRLPLEIWLHVASFLSVHDVVRLARVSKSWHRLIEEPAVWRQLCARHWQFLDTRSETPPTLPRDIMRRVADRFTQFKRDDETSTTVTIRGADSETSTFHSLTESIGTRNRAYSIDSESDHSSSMSTFGTYQTPTHSEFASIGGPSPLSSESLPLHRRRVLKGATLTVVRTLVDAPLPRLLTELHSNNAGIESFEFDSTAADVSSQDEEDEDDEDDDEEEDKDKDKDKEEEEEDKEEKEEKRVVIVVKENEYCDGDSTSDSYDETGDESESESVSTTMNLEDGSSNDDNESENDDDEINHDSDDDDTLDSMRLFDDTQRTSCPSMTSPTSSWQEHSDDDDNDDDDDEKPMRRMYTWKDLFCALYALDAERTYFNVEGNQLGCRHYARQCKVQAPCCKRWVGCRLCHDEVERTHRIDRHRMYRMMCMHCGAAQRVASTCARCQARMARYYCDRCHLFDDEPGKSIYHCDDCGVCRIGLGIGVDMQHCFTCNMDWRLPRMLEGVGGSELSVQMHRCVDGAEHHLCPVCHDRGNTLVHSRRRWLSLPCGHAMHAACHRIAAAACPVCRPRSAVAHVGGGGGIAADDNTSATHDDSTQCADDISDDFSTDFDSQLPSFASTVNNEDDTDNDDYDEGDASVSSSSAPLSTSLATMRASATSSSLTAEQLDRLRSVPDSLSLLQHSKLLASIRHDNDDKDDDDDDDDASFESFFG